MKDATKEDLNKKRPTNIAKETCQHGTEESQDATEKINDVA